MNNYIAKKELLSLPRDYTRAMAIQNNDVIYEPLKNYNTERFLKFLINIERGMEDRIRITGFGIDGPATISILEYKDGKIIYTTDITRYDKSYNINSVEGDYITEALVESSNRYMYLFELKASDGINYEIFKYFIK